MSILSSFFFFRSGSYRVKLLYNTQTLRNSLQITLCAFSFNSCVEYLCVSLRVSIWNVYFAIIIIEILVDWTHYAYESYRNIYAQIVCSPIDRHIQLTLKQSPFFKKVFNRSLLSGKSILYVTVLFCSSLKRFSRSLSVTTLIYLVQFL